ncbi:glycosyltransferase [Cryobacterium melibiosiphilum]|uniref:Glycosyltransferase n=1 Tax=Cryobacterium melibiosiphilum TaxID=995039 RepID=A0A3A5MUC2_9MICO|nr:glycosyltransferase family 4 protein [Cryobacterium melibiosiphilum]RJT89586.1 glycosyltransferase [Cryobacterium melibiosiphilum]
MTAERGLTRAAAHASALALGVVTRATGMLPPRLRYGYVYPLTRALLHQPLPAVQALGAGLKAEPATTPAPAGDLTCVLGVSALDIGGIGSVVELLAAGLPARGVTPAVVCLGDGMRAQRLREMGVQVRTVVDRASALSAFAELGPDVIQLHDAPSFVVAAARDSGVPLVSVLHNTEIHYSRTRWRRFSELLEHSVAAVAVSELVRSFHVGHVAVALRSRITVIPNAAHGSGLLAPQQRRDARELVERAVGGRFGDDVVFVCLARYDAQKNIAGTVASFLACVASGVPAQLVIAGDPSDWVEFRRADAIRRGSRDADRVHLLATSDGQTLIAAADAFLLNSYFEGWPVAATEAWAAGLPLILSDVGGARELVGRDPQRSVLVSNATGNASDVTDARVERSRWSAKRQQNSAELSEAIQRVVDTVHRERDVPVAPRDASAGVAATLDEHARLLRDTAAINTPDEAAQPGRFSGDQRGGTVRI